MLPQPWFNLSRPPLSSSRSLSVRRLSLLTSFMVFCSTTKKFRWFVLSNGGSYGVCRSGSSHIVNLWLDDKLLRCRRLKRNKPDLVFSFVLDLLCSCWYCCFIVMYIDSLLSHCCCSFNYFRLFFSDPCIHASSQLVSPDTSRDLSMSKLKKLKINLTLKWHFNQAYTPR